MMRRLKNLEALKDEIGHLEEASSLLDIIYYSFDSYYDFRDFVVKNAKCYTDTERSKLSSRLDAYFNFDDSE